MGKKAKVVLHPVKDLCESLNDVLFRRDLRDYLNGDAHRAISISSVFAAKLKEQIRAFRQGQVNPHLTVMCCRDCFRFLFSAYLPIFSHRICQPQGETDEEIEQSGCELVSSKVVDGLDGDGLYDYLVHDRGCSLVDGYEVMAADCTVWQAYYEALQSYCEAAAKKALELGSDSARLFLEAERLLLPADADYVNLTPHQAALKENGLVSLEVETAEHLYDLLSEAQGKLWVDSRLHALAHLGKRGKTVKKGRR